MNEGGRGAGHLSLQCGRLRAGEHAGAPKGQGTRTLVYRITVRREGHFFAAEALRECLVGSCLGGDE